MINLLYQFDTLLKDEEDLWSYYLPVENPFEGREATGKVLCAVIENGKFNRLELKDFSGQKLKDYLYRKIGVGTTTKISVNLAG